MRFSKNFQGFTLDDLRILCAVWYVLLFTKLLAVPGVCIDVPRQTYRCRTAYTAKMCVTTVAPVPPMFWAIPSDAP